MKSVRDEQFPVLFTRRLKFLRTPGEALVDVVVEIGQPYWAEQDVEAACPVAIRGTIGRVIDIRGIDPMDAIKQAIGFADVYLDRPTGDERFFWPNGDEF
jgi:hypothetical protein